uniref:TTF-type domain-containing protein n=1 Tax=Nicotiana tabacum TaxID=4097 RepID=A0A1S4BEY4_TOBAC|nr:PREDICTED: uncharacterized protein LOC107807553 [Nicotiana tabacum]
MITKFFKAIPTPQSSGSGSSPPMPSSFSCPIIHDNLNPSAVSNKEKILNLNLEPDPAERKQISKYPPNLRDRVRRYYIQQGPCQPHNCSFPKRDFGGFMRQFNLEWFNTSYSGWLEYSVKVDAAFCLCCYLFKNEHGGHGKVGDSFTKNGFRAWNKATERLNAHIGEVNSLHNRCFMMMRDLINQEQSILTSFDKQSEKIKSDYRVRLNASIDVAKFLLKQGMSFRGHDEGETSIKRGNFVELLQWYADRDDEVKKVVLQSAPQNNMMIAPNIQKEIVNACAKEIIKAIVEDLNGDYFGILVDESKDVSHKEQMALVLRSFKRRNMLREDQAKKLEELQVLGEVHTGSGLNQELGLQRSAITNDLNIALQRKDQDIVNAMKLVGFAKRQLQHDIVIPEMDKNYHLGKSKRRSSSVTYSHHLRVEAFNTVIDLQLSELNSRFDAVNSNLLLGMASLSPDNSFFSGSKLEDLSYELDNYILFVKEDNDVCNLKGLGDLSETLVETDLYKTWRLVFLLVKLSLILPVATATVERAFSSMKYIKNYLRSRIGDEFLNDCLVCYIEDKVFESVPNDAIIDHFQNMTTRRVQL